MTNAAQTIIALTLAAALAPIARAAEPPPNRENAIDCEGLGGMSREELLETLERAVATGVDGWPRADTFCLERDRPVSELQRARKPRRELKP